MQPQEILPSPEIGPQNHSPEKKDGLDEIDGARASELPGKSSPQGSAALSGAAVDDAQGQVQSSHDYSVATQQNPIPHQDFPDVADDIELIEKIWVQKAKKIVSETVGDPYSQNIKINRMKADYIKKRYDKDVKFTEEK